MAEKKDCIFNRADDCRTLKMKYCRWEEKECKFYKSCKIYNETGMLKTRKDQDAYSSKEKGSGYMSLKGNVKEYLKQLADLKEEYKDKRQAILRLEQYIEKL